MVMEEIYKRGSIGHIDTAVRLLWNLTEINVIRNRKMKKLPRDVVHIRRILMTECFELYAKKILSLRKNQVCVEVAFCAS